SLSTSCGLTETLTVRAHPRRWQAPVRTIWSIGATLTVTAGIVPGDGGAAPDPSFRLRTSAYGTTAVAVAVTASTGGSSTSAADGERSDRERHTTRQRSCRVRLRVPTRTTSPVTSTTSPARIGARNLISESPAS